MSSRIISSNLIFFLHHTTLRTRKRRKKKRASTRRWSPIRTLLRRRRRRVACRRAARGVPRVPGILAEMRGLQHNTTQQTPVVPRRKSSKQLMYNMHDPLPPAIRSCTDPSSLLTNGPLRPGGPNPPLRNDTATSKPVQTHLYTKTSVRDGPLGESLY